MSISIVFAACLCLVKVATWISYGVFEALPDFLVSCCTHTIHADNDDYLQGQGGLEVSSLPSVGCLLCACGLQSVVALDNLTAWLGDVAQFLALLPSVFVNQARSAGCLAFVEVVARFRPFCLVFVEFVAARLPPLYLAFGEVVLGASVF